MGKPNWTRTLGEVLNQKTEQKELISEKTGNTYITDVVPILTVFSIGGCEENGGKYRYSIVDTVNDLEYSIKVPNKIDVKFGTQLRFKNVRGGMTQNGNGWYSADSVEEVKGNAS